MFSQNKITGVVGSKVFTGAGQGNASVRRASRPTPTKLSASAADSVGFGGSSSMSANVLMQSQYQYMLTGILPADPLNGDAANLALFYRDCYLLDAVAGSAVDIQSTFPFSDYELRGLEEKELVPFNETLEQLNIRQMLPEISTSYLVDGFFCGSLIYDERAKVFKDTLVHDALQCALVPSPFYNLDPAITVNASAAVHQFLASQSIYAKRYLNSLPASFRKVLNEGTFTLDPITTMFIARKALTDRAYVSYLHRVLPMYLIEKALFRGTLVESMKRQRAMTHITAGDDGWTPTGEELQAYVQAFQDAEQDPMGGWVATRNAVQVADVRQGGDFFKWTDMGDILVAYKMRALGISEAFLSGEASYAAAESAYSTFLETSNSYRSHLTAQIFQRRIFPLVAVTQGLYKDASKVRRNDSPLDFLYNANNSNNLKLPIVHWHKSLEAKEEDNMYDLLDKATEKGVPIPLKMWMAACNIDPETLVRDLREDKAFTANLNKLKGDVETQQPEGSEEDPEDFDAEVDSHLQRLTSTSVNAGYTDRVGLAAREFDSHEMVAFTKTGQRKHVYNQAEKQRDLNHKIARIALEARANPEYRMRLAKRNQEILGRTTLPQ